MVGVRDKITSLCRNFLWSGKSNIRKKPLVSWKEICRPKNEGGLGVIDLSSWNLSLLSKGLWNLQSKKDSLWVKWVNHFYMKDRPFWEYVPEKQDSQIVRYLSQIRDRIVIEEGSKQAALDRISQWVDKGNFIVKASYDFFRAKGGKPCWTKVVWHRSLMPKHAFILWLSLKERLLTRDKLSEHIEDTSCVFCGSHLETIDHLFFQCRMSRQVWVDIKTWLGFTRELNTIKAAVKWTIKEARGTGVQAIAKRMGIACTVYCIWKHRNGKIFDGKATQPACIVRDIKMQTYRSLHGYFPNFKDL